MLFKRRELVLSSLPTPPPPFSPILPPRSIKLRVTYPCICSPPVRIIRSATSLSLATTTCTPEHPFFLNSLLSEHISSDDTCVLGGELLSGYNTWFFLQRGCCCQGKEIALVDHIRGKWLSSRLTSGSKISLTASLEPCPQGPAPSSLAAAHSPFQCVPCFVHSMPVLAASHSSLA